MTLIEHLATVHPARYVGLVDGVRTAGLLDVAAMPGQTEALRFVALVDRLYDAQVGIVAGGVPLDRVFGDEMLAGGYRKKYPPGDLPARGDDARRVLTGLGAPPKVVPTGPKHDVHIRRTFVTRGKHGVPRGETSLHHTRSGFPCSAQQRGGPAARRGTGSLPPARTREVLRSP